MKKRNWFQIVGREDSILLMKAKYWTITIETSDVIHKTIERLRKTKMSQMVPNGTKKLRKNSVSFVSEAF